jgi:N-ethylmaleimide reductase
MKAKALLQPYNIGKLDLKNRIVMAPMTRGRAGGKHIPNDIMAEYYSQRADAGLIITEATFISEQAIGWIDAGAIYLPAHVEGWKKVVEAVHAKDGAIYCQLWHCGRASHSSFHNGELPVAPSAVKINLPTIHTPIGKVPYETPRALDFNEIKQVVADYKFAAKLAKDAGFDGIELHSANGYLLDQFLQSKINLRSDEYGGSIEKRYRLLKEVTEAAIEVWGPDRVGVRLSPNGIYNDTGSPDFRETFLYVAEELNKMPLAYLHLVDGLAFGFHNLGEPITLKEARTVFKRTLIGNCGYTVESGEQAIEAGDADLIAYGRPFISNPDLVDRFANDWPLNPDADPKVWSVPGASGYTDFPTHREFAEVEN